MLPTALSALIEIALLASFASALALPAAAPKLPRCTPRLSGLAQYIKVGRNDLAWKSVPATGGAVAGGIKLASLPAHPDALYEFIIEPEQSGFFALSAASSTSATCSSSGNSKLQHPLGASCTPSHSFRIICQDCDDHDDAASGCQLRLDPSSRGANAGKCIEASEGGQATAKLSWGECVLGNQKGELKGREKERRLARQLFNISPS